MARNVNSFGDNLLGFVSGHGAIPDCLKDVAMVMVGLADLRNCQYDVRPDFQPCKPGDK